MLVDRRVRGHGVLEASILWNIWWSSYRYPKCVPLEGEAKIARNDGLVREDFDKFYVETSSGKSHLCGRS